MRLVLDARIRCVDGDSAGLLGDVVVEPHAGRVTHLVVRSHGPEPARLVPLGLATAEAQDRSLKLRCTRAELATMPMPQDFSLRQADEEVEPEEGWDIGIESDIPYGDYSTGSFGDFVGDLEPMGAVTFDRIPKGTVELRRGSVVEYGDGRAAGTLHALDLDGDAITHVVYEHGFLWRRKRIPVAVADVEDFATDAIVLAPGVPRA